MGEVYRAHDPRLKRDVAVKVLLPAVAGDADRLARFEREAQILAALNHPGIAAILGLEQAGDTTALVLEFVDGPTLADRIAEGPMAVDEARQVARQIVDALEAAHEQGIVHRDLKPANIKLRPDGTVKVLDFGLAKAVESPISGAQAAAQSPTITSPVPLTGAGMLLGTAAYMSPEQARGKAADKRSDIWAFGCVLYEMLAGRRAFGSDDVTETIAAVVMSEPEWTALPAATPASWRRLLTRCLDKDVRARLRDIGDARFDLLGSDQPAGVPTPAGRPGERLAWAAAVGAALAAGWLLGPSASVDNVAVEPPLIATIAPPPDAWSVDVGAISPDGRMVALTAFADGAERLYIRSLDSQAADWKRVTGTTGARAPFWSPDSRQVAFFAQRRLKSVPASGAPVTVIAEVGRITNASGAWAADGIYFGAQIGPLRKVTPTGQTVVVPLGEGQSMARKPNVLPGSRVALRISGLGGDSNHIFSASTTDPADRPRLVTDALDPTVWRDWLLYVKGSALLAQRLSPDARSLIEEQPVVLANDVAVPGGATSVTVSNDGALLYRAVNAGPYPVQQLQWFDRTGRPVAFGETLVTDPAPSPRISPDGRTVAFQRSGNIWLWPLTGGVPQPFTTDPAFQSQPVWRRDGLSWYDQVQDAIDSPLSAYSPRVLVTSTAHSLYPSDWSADGRTLLLTASGQEESSSRDIYRWSRDTGQLSAVVESPADEVAPRFSPDGRWIAYHADDSGDFEVFVRPASGQALPLRISKDGGLFPAWRGDGRELFFIGRHGGIFAVDVAWGAAPTFGEPKRLFDAPIMVQDAQQAVPFDVTPDGQRFVAVVLNHQGASLTYVRNLQSLLERASRRP